MGGRGNAIQVEGGGTPSRGIDNTVGAKVPQRVFNDEWYEEADAVFRGHYVTLKRRADRIGGRVLDGDDLLSDAMEQLMLQRGRGRGPADGVVAYLTRSMLNKVIDEARSPRSRVRLFHDGEELPQRDHHDFRVHHAPEVEWVRRAMDRLPSASRSLLMATVVDERAPSEIIEEQGRSPNAVYSAIRRAKLRLRRELLLVVLEEDAPTTCQAEIRKLPDVIAQELDDMDASSEGVAHLRDCTRCTAGWNRFREIRHCL